MALISKFAHVTRDRHVVHSETECVYSIFTDPRGGRYLQLDTVGSTDRKIVGKVSQSIQLDHNAARQLFDLLVETFPELAVNRRS
jgi:hypothetical protein